MATYGVTPQGFARKTIENIIDELEADEKAEMADNLDVSTESVVGQFNGIFGRQLGIAWEQLETCYNGFDPDVAEGRLLEMLAKLTGTFRRGNTHSEVILTCDLDAGVVLQPDVHFAHLEDRPDIRWTPSPTLYPDGYTASVSGLQPVTFIAELTGPVEGLAGTINHIATPVVGWNNVLNANDAELGKLVDTDPELRTRREAELATVGSATVRSITSNVAQAFPDKISNLLVFENDTDAVDSNGLPPHSIEVLIFDGEVPSVNDDELAQVIYDSKAGGIRAYGQESGTAKALVNGVEVDKEVGFTRADVLTVYIDVDLDKRVGYPGDAEIKRIVAEAANAYFGPGDSVDQSHLIGFHTAIGGVARVNSLKFGLAASPTNTAILPVTIRQIARFDTSRITVTAH